MQKINFKFFLALLPGILLVFGCYPTHRQNEDPVNIIRDTLTTHKEEPVLPALPKPKLRIAITIPRNITVTHYFPFMDSLIFHYDSLLNYPLTEHVLVLQNPWIIDTLRSFDYYLSIARGRFIENQREMVVLHRGDTLFLPTENEAFQLIDRLSHTLIDVNIPEYKLRIFIYDTIAYTFPVRVGRNEHRFLQTVGREVNLQTPIGDGIIVRIARDPYFVNPTNGHVYYMTRRDDGRYTRMPRIPWLEPMLNGQRPGSLIHPTTNPVTLEKAYSNGCVGTPEGDAWIIYYNAPIGTKVRFRYDLTGLNEAGDTLHFADIYGLEKRPVKFK